CENLWSRGLGFELHLIGLAQAQTGREALAKVRALQAAGRPLRYDGPVDDDALETAYAECAFTVYPSLMEGFGLPVIESMERGKPCICSARGALGESARGGGCITLDTVDAANLAQAMERLLADSGLRDTLSAEAQQRRFKRWSDYATELLIWMSNVHPRTRS
ncbi:MAG TPA: glycosyltransferase, partial [Opitutaceae bacterium]